MQRLRFAHRRRINTATGYAMGGFDKVLEYSPEDLDEDFRRKNRHILKHKRGGGYWLWKPYIIKRTLEWMGEGDFLLYADAASLFAGPVEPLIEVMRQKNQDILLFRAWHRGRPRFAERPRFAKRQGFKERHWTKRDAFTLMGCDAAQYTDTVQIESSFSLWRKTALSMKLASEWLSYAQDERIITDMPNQGGKENYPEFKEHRHDQSIWSLLCKKHQIQGESCYNWGSLKSCKDNFIFLFRGRIHTCVDFCLVHPMEFRLNFLILREIIRHRRLKLLLIRCLRKITSVGLNFLNG